MAKISRKYSQIDDRVTYSQTSLENKKNRIEVLFFGRLLSILKKSGISDEW